MKKYAKILCAILVVAALCSSLIFTVGADEGEPFAESFKAVDFAGNTITSGTTYKSDVAGNRITGVSTGNESNSPFLTLAKAEAENPWIVAYANQTKSYKGGNNNLYINASTSNSSPFTVVGNDAKGYYVVDFDVATNGDMLPGFDVSVVMRRASDTSGFPFSEELYIGNYITEKEAWTHVTIVGDIKNNVAKIYINGEYVADGGKAVRNGSDAIDMHNDTQVVALGFRLELTRNTGQTDVTHGQNTAFDNFSHRLFIEDGDSLTAALSDGNITDWSGYTAGRGGDLLPVVATADGVEYRNFNSLQKAFATNDTIDVDFLAKPFGPFEICANANINTNGMAQSDLFKLASNCEIVSVSGNIVSTKAPFVGNNSEKGVTYSGFDKNATSVNVNEIFNATKGNAKGNLYDRFNTVTGGKIINLGTAGYRGGTIISDSVTGTTIYCESGTPAKNSTALSYANEYSNFNFTKQILTYEAGKNEYIVVDFDYTFDGTLDGIFVQLIPRGSSGYHAAGMSLKNLPVTAGEMVHITAVHDFTDNVAYYFINGALACTLDGAAINSGAHSKYLNGSEEIRVEEYKLGSNSLSTVYFANMNIRAFDVDASADTIDAAIKAQDISLWDNNIYTSEYKIAQFPAIATVDGVPYHNKATLEAALYGNKKTPAIVKVLHAFDDVITVNCDANIYTYGQNVSFVDANGKTLTPAKNGIIYLDVAYMPIRAEETVDVTGGTASQDIYNAIKFNVSGNLFASVVPSAGNWNQLGYRASSLVTNIETGDVVYRSFAMLGSDGKLNAGSKEYTDMKFRAATFSYSAGNNSYVVVDFDFATDRSLNDDVAVTLATSAGVPANALLLKDLGILDGDNAHVTVVYDFTNNAAYAFVNGLFACSVEGAALADNAGYLAGTAVTVDTFRLSTEGMTSSVCLDNVAIRTFSYAEADDTLIDTVASGNITDWADSIFGSNYTISKIPAVATVDGRDYGSIDTVNKLLAIGTTYVKSVEIKYAPAASVLIRTEATVETNGLNVSLDWNTGLYEFDPGVERYRGTRTGLAYASTKFIYTTVGTAYTFEVIDAENCWSNASVAAWAYKVTRSGAPIVLEDYDVVFYPHGEKMEPIVDGKYVENGSLVKVTWFEMQITSETTYKRVAVEEYPIASASESLKIYIAQVGNESVSYAATDMLYSANISTGIEFIFYVNKNQTATNTGNVVTINGKEYVAFVYNLAPHEIDKVITVSFDVKNVTDIYTQTQDICFIDYIRGLLEDGSVDKSLIVSLLNYANEAHALLNGGEKMAEVTELVNAYAEYLPNEELTEKLDTTALSSVIRSASIRMNSTPEFVFKVAIGFRGTITISYNSLGTTKEYSVYVNTLACEENITLKGLNVYDVAGDMTITVTPYGSDESIVGQYNLATYAQGLEDNGFAVALYNYAKAALEYRANAEKHLPV